MRGSGASGVLRGWRATRGGIEELGTRAGARARSGLKLGARWSG
jgi:hypothetical protein